MRREGKGKKSDKKTGIGGEKRNVIRRKRRTPPIGIEEERAAK